MNIFKKTQPKPQDWAFLSVKGEYRFYYALNGGVYERRSYDGAEWTEPVLLFVRHGISGVQAVGVRQKIYLLVAAGKKLYLYMPSGGAYVGYPYPVIDKFPNTSFKAARSDGEYLLFAAKNGEIFKFTSVNCIDWDRETVKAVGFSHLPEGAVSPMEGYKYILYSDSASSYIAITEGGEERRVIAETQIGAAGLKCGMIAGKYVFYTANGSEPMFIEPESVAFAFESKEKL